MKKYIPYFTVVGLLALTSVVIAKPASETEMVSLPEKAAEAAKRPCAHPAGGWATIATDNVSSTSSGELNEWTRYVLQCFDESYICWGAAACTADTSDGYLPADSWYEFLTTPSSKFVGLRNRDEDSSCVIIECQ